ncbi:hypothetical protein ACQKKK_12410 [Peribacillus sp. NPDC006672]|uniref:hypothetical protein n=1 Tax=Peribacillus sp. NPDC006672 TaxID=3390606 RepID=UPI003D04FC9C
MATRANVVLTITSLHMVKCIMIKIGSSVQAGIILHREIRISISTDQIFQTRVELTFMDGKQVWSRNNGMIQASKSRRGWGQKIIRESSPSG